MRQLQKETLTIKCRDCGKELTVSDPVEAFQHTLSHGTLPMGQADLARHWELLKINHASNVKDEIKP